MASPTFNGITPIDPYKSFAETTRNAANFFFDRAKDIEAQEQAALRNKLAIAQLQEQKRLNDMDIKTKNFALESALKEEQEKEEKQDYLSKLVPNADRLIVANALADDKKYLNNMNSTVVELFDKFAKQEGIDPATAPTITAKEGTEEYLQQKIARDEWSKRLDDVRSKFNKAYGNRINQTYSNTDIVDKKDASAVLLRKLLQNGFTPEEANKHTLVLTSKYRDYQELSNQARKAAEEKAKILSDQGKALIGAGNKALPNNNTTSTSRSSSKRLLSDPNMNVYKYLKDNGIEVEGGFIDFWNGSSETIGTALRKLAERGYPAEVANKAVIQAVIAAKNDMGSYDEEAFLKSIDPMAKRELVSYNQRTQQIQNGTGSRLAAAQQMYRAGVDLFNRSNRTIQQAMNLGLQSGIKQQNLENLRNLLLDFTKKTTTPAQASTKQPIAASVVARKPVSEQPNPLTNVQQKRANPVNVVQPQPQQVTDTVDKLDADYITLGNKALMDPTVRNKLEAITILRDKLKYEDNPKQAIVLKQQLDKVESDFNNINNVPTQQLRKILAEVQRFKSGGSGVYDLSYEEFPKHIKTVGDNIQQLRSKLEGIRKAYDKTGLPQFKAQEQEYLDAIRSLQQEQVRLGNHFKKRMTGFLDSIAP